jgi:hypothetical protein
MLKKLSVLILCLLAAAYPLNKKKILKAKGFDGMKERIVPEILSYHDGVTTVLGIGKPDCFALVDGNFRTVVVKLNNDGSFEKDPMPEEFLGDAYYSDGEHNVVWAKLGRQFSALNLDTRKYGRFLISHNGADAMLTTSLLDAEKMIFSVDLIKYGLGVRNSPVIYYLFDMLNDTIIYKSQRYYGDFFPYDKDKVVWSESIRDTHDVYRGSALYFADYRLNKLQGNALFKELADLKIEISGHLKRPYHFGNRRMIGYRAMPGLESDIFFSIRWDEGFTDYKIEPFTIQKPEGYAVNEYFKFSGDGKWVKTTVSPDTNLHEEELAFLQVNDDYPQGLSFPLFGEKKTDFRTPGAFVNHSTWGPLYVELDYDHEKALLVYKLNDGLNYLKKLGIPQK